MAQPALPEKETETLWPWTGLARTAAQPPLDPWSSACGGHDVSHWALGGQHCNLRCSPARAILKVIERKKGYALLTKVENKT